MQKKELGLIAALLVLAALYVHFFTHWHEKGQIAIEATLRPNRRGRTSSTIVAFSLNNDYALISLKVVPLDGTVYNPLAMPVWHLVSDSNSSPVRAFPYGYPLKGMQPALKGVHPEPLGAGTNYRLILTSRDASGYKDFRMR